MLWNAGCRHSGISSYGSWDCLLWGMWYIPRPGNEPVSLALADGLFTIRPAGKSYQYVFNFVILEPVKFTGKLQAYYKESLQTPIPVPRLLTSAFADIHPFPPHVHAHIFTDADAPLWEDTLLSPCPALHVADSQL